MSTKEKQAVEIFGEDVFSEVTTIVNDIGEADSVFTLYEDLGKYTHMECVSFLYFE